jgi:hypothetical protein
MALSVRRKREKPGAPDDEAEKSFNGAGRLKKSLARCDRSIPIMET